MHLLLLVSVGIVVGAVDVAGAVVQNGIRLGCKQVSHVWRCLVGSFRLGLLCAMEAGLHFLPLDLRQPVERLEAMLEMAGRFGVWGARTTSAALIDFNCCSCEPVVAYLS